MNLFSDKPGIYLPRNKQVTMELLKGNSATLKCVAAANPSPTFAWRKGKHGISVGFNRTWNSSSLKVTPISNGDFTTYVCTAKNQLGWDSATFDLQDKGKCQVCFLQLVSRKKMLWLFIVFIYCSLHMFACIWLRSKALKNVCKRVPIFWFYF